MGADGITVKTFDEKAEIKSAGASERRRGVSLLSKIPTRRQFVGNGDKHVNAFINNLRESISSELDDNSLGLDVKVFEFLKTEIPELSYSYVVIVAKYREEVGYFVTELAATGVPGLSPSAILSKLESKNPLFTIPGNAIEENLNRIIIDELSHRSEYSGLKIIPMTGIIVFDSVDLEDTDVAAEVAGTAVSYMSTRLLENAGEFSDLDVVDYVNKNDMQIEVSIVSTSDTAVSATGDTRYVTFDTTATLFNTDHKGGPNDEGSDIFFCNVKGNVQLLPVENEITNVRGEVIGTERKFAPMIVLNTVDALWPSGGMTAFGIYLAAQLNVDNKWLEVLLNNAGPGKDPGTLLKLIDDENGKPLPAVHFEKQKSKTKVLQIARTFLLEDAMVVVDVPAFGAYSAQLLKYYVAASKSRKANSAKNSIIKDWENITAKNIVI